MNITYKWTISGVDGTPKDDDKVNVVRVIHWRCAGFVSDQPSISNSRNGFVILDEPNGHTFIDYNDLTEANVKKWLFDALTPPGKLQIEQDIAQQLSLADRLLAIKNRNPLWMHWDPELGPEPAPPVPVPGPPPEGVEVLVSNTATSNTVANTVATT